MKPPLALPVQKNHSPIQTRKLILSFVLTAIASSACAVGALINGREQLPLWAAVMIIFVIGEFFYALRLTCRHATSTAARARREFYRRRKQRRLQK